jgi:hypothetical protein
VEHHPLNGHSQDSLIRRCSKSGLKRDTTDKHLTGEEPLSNKTELSDEARHGKPTLFSLLYSNFAGSAAFPPIPNYLHGTPLSK